MYFIYKQKSVKLEKPQIGFKEAKEQGGLGSLNITVDTTEVPLFFVTEGSEAYKFVEDRAKKVTELRNSLFKFYINIKGFGVGIKLPEGTIIERPISEKFSKDVRYAGNAICIIAERGCRVTIDRKNFHGVNSKDIDENHVMVTVYPKNIRWEKYEKAPVIFIQKEGKLVDAVTLQTSEFDGAEGDTRKYRGNILRTVDVTPELETEFKAVLATIRAKKEHPPKRRNSNDRQKTGGKTFGNRNRTGNDIKTKSFDKGNNSAPTKEFSQGKVAKPAQQIKNKHGIPVDRTDERRPNRGGYDKSKGQRTTRNY